MSRDVDATCRGIEATIPFVITRVTYEDTSDRACDKFVRGGGFRVRVAQAPKDTEVSVRGWCLVKGLVRGDERERRFVGRRLRRIVAVVSASAQ